MGSERPGVAINEAVFLLAQTAPEKLKSIRDRYPYLAEELQEGIYAGPGEGEATAWNSYLREKAEIVAVALEEASSRAERSMTFVAVTIQRARLRRLVSQMLVLIGSSSLLGAVALAGKTATVISAVLTLLAAIGNLLAEHHEKLLNPQAGNIYEAFQKLGEGAYKARGLTAELQLAMRYQEGENTLTELVREANELCEQLNAWLIQILNQFPSSLPVKTNKP